MTKQSDETAKVRLVFDGEGESTRRKGFDMNLLHVFDDLEREEEEVSFLFWFQKKEEQTL